MAKQRFSKQNQRGEMKSPAVQQGDWADLGSDFQQALRQQWTPAQPLQVRCAVREQTLLVLVEHLLHVEPTPEETLESLEQTIRQVMSDGQALQSKPESLGVDQLPVQLFLRIAGYQQPYASRQFEIDLKPAAKPVVPVAPLSPVPPSESPTAPAAIGSIAPVTEPISEPVSEPALETSVAPEVEAPEVEAPAEPPESTASAVLEPPVPEPPAALVAEPVLQPLLNESAVTATQEVEVSETATDLAAEPLPDELSSVAAASDGIVSEVTTETVTISELSSESTASEAASLETPTVLDQSAAESATLEAEQPEGIIPETLPEAIRFEPLQTEPFATESGVEAEQPQLEPVEKNLILEEIAKQAEAIQSSELSLQIEATETDPENRQDEASEPFLQPAGEALPAEPVANEPTSEATFPIASSEPAAFAEPMDSVDPVEFSEPAPGLELLQEDLQAESSAPESSAPELDSDSLLPVELSAPEQVSAPEQAVEALPQIAWLEPEQPEAEPISVEQLQADLSTTPIATELDPAVLDENLVDPLIEPGIEPEWMESESTMIQAVEITQKIPDPQVAIPAVSEAVEAASSSELSIAAPLFEASSAELAPAVLPDSDSPLAPSLEPFTGSELASEPASTEPSPDTELAESLLTEASVATQPIEPQMLPAVAEEASADTDQITAHVDAATALAAIEFESEQQFLDEPDLELSKDDAPPEPVMDLGSNVYPDQNDRALDADPLSELDAVENNTVLQGPVRQTWVAPVSTEDPVVEVAGVNGTIKSVAPSPGHADSRTPARRFRWSASTLTLAGGVGGFLVASGLYMLSRPCVLGGCEPLQRAEQLGQTAIQTAQTTDSSLAVVEAYGKLNEASYLLGTIPAWSRYHPAAQSLLNRYEDQSVVLGQVVKALEQANTAAQRSQNPPHPLQEWREIQWQWREVISQLEKIPPNHSLYGLVQRKLTEYRANLTGINQRVTTEQQAQDRVTAARQLEQAAEDRIKAAKTPANWQETATIWTKAIEQLRQIPQGTMPYDEAQQLLAIYQPKLAEANAQRVQEQSGVDAYRQALNAAQQARETEQQNQWTQAVNHWQDALSYAQQVPSNTSYYSQVQPLLSTYAQSLQQAQQNAQRAVSLQTVRPALDRACDGSPQPCTYTLSPQSIRVQFTAFYDKTVSALITKTPTTESDLPAAVVNQVNELLRNLATVGDTTRIPIELYDSEGTKLGTYTPELSGYVPQS